MLKKLMHTCVALLFMFLLGLQALVVSSCKDDPITGAVFEEEDESEKGNEPD